MTHVVALSGGKDSTAMALRLAEIEPREYVYVCTPTGDEAEAMFAHWRRLGALLGKPIQPVMGGTLESIIDDEQTIPNWRMRFCTRRLKIAPFAAWLAQHTPATAYIGLRADEPEREGGDYVDVAQVVRRCPLREWGWKVADVWGYLEVRGVTIPERTDCELCFFQRLGEWYRLWETNPTKFARGEAIEATRGATFRSPGRDAWPAALKDLRAEFERGNVPKNALQRDLFAELKCRVCRT
jgi:3'-phosphoadenosine 5'-phosphosulfate sulfotransferase (PAPS reductase)/FAD synthetase